MTRHDEVLARIEFKDGIHVLRRECEVEDVKVLLHALLMSRLRDDDDVALGEVAQCDLCCGLAILLTDGCQHGIGEETVFAFSQWPPCHMSDAELIHVLTGDLLLLEDVGLNLVDSRCDLVVVSEVDEVVGIEVAHAYGTNLS